MPRKKYCQRHQRIKARGLAATLSQKVLATKKKRVARFAGKKKPMEAHPHSVQSGNAGCTKGLTTLLSTLGPEPAANFTRSNNLEVSKRWRRLSPQVFFSCQRQASATWSQSANDKNYKSADNLPATKGTLVCTYRLLKRR